MKSLLATICILVMVIGVIGTTIVKASETAAVNATVTITALSITSITPSAFAYGTMATGADKKYTATDGAQAYGIKVVNGSSAADIKIKGANTTGGDTAWTLHETTVGTNQYIHKYAWNTTGNEDSPHTFDSYVGLTTENATLKAGVLGDGIVYFDLEIHTPTISGDVGVEKTVPVTVTAVAPI